MTMLLRTNALEFGIGRSVDGRSTHERQVDAATVSISSRSRVMLLFDEVISTLIWESPMTDEIGRIEPRIGLHDLRVLMVVVEAGSMGKAARLLATSQPAVSRSIGELEHALGVRLLDRSAQGIEPTPYGRALLKRGTAVFDELQQGIKDIRFLSDPTVGDLTIGASIAIAEGFICSVITRLSHRYPRLTFQVHATDTATAYQALRRSQSRSCDRACYQAACRGPHECGATIAGPARRGGGCTQSPDASAPDQPGAVGGGTLGVTIWRISRTAPL